MENFLRSFQLEGQHDSTGFFSLAREQAVRKLAEYRVNDPAFPYWKFLQGAYGYNAKLVKMAVGKSTVTIEAYGARAFPPLSEICNQMPEPNSTLEPWQSCALALGSETGDAVWLYADSAFGDISTAGLGDRHSYELEKQAPKPPKFEQDKGDHRIVLVHRFAPKGNLLSRLFSGGRQRRDLEAHLRTRLALYPQRCVLSGHPVNINNIERIFGSHRGGYAWEQQTCAAYYRGVLSRDPGRFASEPLAANAFSSYACLEDGQFETVAERLMGPATLVYSPAGSPVFLPVFRRVESGFSQHSEDEVQVRLDLCDFRVASNRAHPVGRRVTTFSQAQPCHCDLAVLLPRKLEGNGLLAVVDRGVLLGVWPTEWEVPGLMVICNGQGLDIDLSGTEIVKNKAVDAKVEEVRALLPAVIQATIPHLIPGSQAQNAYREILARV